MSNLGDGIALSAGPLLVASQTRDPLLVASAAILQRLPWLIFGLYAGAIADRFDRKKIIIIGNLVRVAVLAAITASIVADNVGITIILVAVFLLGCAETFVDNTANTLLPMIVAREHLGTANARFVLGFSTVNQLAGPSLGALLFTLGMAWPFVTQAVLMLAAIGLLLPLELDPVATPPERVDLRGEIASGVRWLWAHSPVRTLALTITAFNLTFGAAWSVLVLYSIEVLQSGDVGFGLLTSSAAVGGVFGAAAYDRLERRFRLATLMRAGLVIETATHLGLALTTTQWVAMVIMGFFGAHAAVWGTTSRSVRQRAVPNEFQGRVGSVYSVGLHGGIFVGSILGGVVAKVAGVVATLWFAFGGSALILVLVWSQLENIAHAGAAEGPLEEDRSRAASAGSDEIAREGGVV